MNGVDPSGLLLGLCGLSLGQVLHAGLVTFNAVSFVYSAASTIQHGIGAICALRDDDFWEFFGHSLLAAVNGVGTLLSWTGLKAALATTPAQIMDSLRSIGAFLGFGGQHGSLAFAGAGGAAAAEAVLAIDIVAEWAITVAARPLFGIFLTAASNQVPLQEHHKIPWDNSKYDFQNHPLVKAAGKDLESDLRNKMLLANHRGRHAKTYLETIKQWLDDAWATLTNPNANPSQTQASNVLDDVIDDVEQGIIDKTLKPYKSKDVWKP